MFLPSSITDMSITMMITSLIILTMSATLMQVIDAGIAPKISPVRPILKALPGKIAVMPCEATGKPTPSITWERDGTPIQMFGSRFSVNKESKALRVFRMVTDDSGNYTCIAKNKFGMDSVTITLLVLVKPEAMITSPTNFTFMEGTNQEIVCRSRGLPRPTFEWQTNQHKRIRAQGAYFDNIPTYSQMYAREREVDDEVSESVLVFEPITSEDYGMFTCVASNDVGSTRACVDLDVRFPPKKASGVVSPEHVTWWRGHDVELKCEVLGNELPEVTWFRDGWPADCKISVDTDHGPQVTSICAVSSSRYGGAGNYSCYANNSLGSLIAHEFNVKEIYPPPPVNYELISVQPYEIVLSVKIPVYEGVAPSTYVEATFRLPSGGPTYESTADVNEQGEAIIRLRGVLPNQTYIISLRARNIAGFGPENEMFLSTDMPYPTPPSATLNTRTTPTRTTSNDDQHAGNDRQDSPSSSKDDNTHNNNNNNAHDDDVVEGDFSVDNEDRGDVMSYPTPPPTILYTQTTPARTTSNDNQHARNDRDDSPSSGNDNIYNNNNNADDNDVVEGDFSVDNEDRDMEVATAYKVLGGNNGASTLHLAFTNFNIFHFCFFTICCLHS